MESDRKREREAERDRGNEERRTWVFWSLFTQSPNKRKRDEWCHGTATIDNTTFSFHAPSCRLQYATKTVVFIVKIMKSTQYSLSKCSDENWLCLQSLFKGLRGNISVICLKMGQKSDSAKSSRESFLI